MLDDKIEAVMDFCKTFVIYPTLSVYEPTVLYESDAGITDRSIVFDMRLRLDEDEFAGFLDKLVIWWGEHMPAGYTWVADRV